MANRKEPPAEFVARLRRSFPDFVDLRYNDAVNRWEFVFLSAAQRPVSQFFGWQVNPLTGQKLEPDELGMYPFRDLTPDAQEEIIRSCEKTFIGNRADGAGTWRKHMSERRQYNRELLKTKARQRGETFAEIISELDLRRPWVKYHRRSNKKQVFA